MRNEGFELRPVGGQGRECVRLVLEAADGDNRWDELAWHSDNSQCETQPVKLKKMNPLGLHDMVGNVREWVADYYAEDYFANSPVGYFGAGTGAAAALRAAAHFGEGTRAVVSQGGRLDLTGEEALAAVKAPTLLLVGGRTGQHLFGQSDRGRGSGEHERCLFASGHINL